MKTLFKSLIVACAMIVSITSTAQAAPVVGDKVYSFADISVNYLDWQGNGEKQKGETGFGFVELEGGAAYEFLEVYGFTDIENHHGDDGTFTKLQARVGKLGGVTVFTQYVGMNYSEHKSDWLGFDKGFNEQNYFLGGSMDTHVFGHTQKWHIAKRWTEGEYANSDLYSGSNGYQFGFVFMGKVAETRIGDFSYSTWGEINFDRSEDYHQHGTGFNGAVALWYDPTFMDADLGIQYRYAHDDIGAQGGAEGVIYTVRYTF